MIRSENPSDVEADKRDDVVAQTERLLHLLKRMRYQPPELWRPRAAELVNDIASSIGLIDQRGDRDAAGGVVTDIESSSVLSWWERLIWWRR